MIKLWMIFNFDHIILLRWSADSTSKYFILNFYVSINLSIFSLKSSYLFILETFVTLDFK